MRQVTAILGVVLIAAAAASAGTTFTWNGSVSSNWENEDNWTPSPTPNPLRWPGENGDIDDDIAVVRFEFGMTNMPVKHAGTNITIAKLQILYNTTQQHGATVRIDRRDQEQNHVIFIMDGDGLTVESDCLLSIGNSGDDPEAEVQLHGGGNIVLDGIIEFAGSNSALELYGVDKTYVTTGSGSIRGTEVGHIPAGDQTVLVLGPGNAINGSVKIYAPLVNHGLVDTDIPGVANYGDTIILYCEPKVGSGTWAVNGGGSGQGQQNTMIVLTPVAGTGNLVVGANGFLVVRRHFSLYGTLTQLGSISVDPDIMFDVGVFDAEGCP